MILHSQGERMFRVLLKGIVLSIHLQNVHVHAGVYKVSINMVIIQSVGFSSTLNL